MPASECPAPSPSVANRFSFPAGSLEARGASVDIAEPLHGPRPEPRHQSPPVDTAGGRSRSVHHLRYAIGFPPRTIGAEPPAGVDANARSKRLTRHSHRPRPGGRSDTIDPSRPRPATRRQAMTRSRSPKHTHPIDRHADQPRDQRPSKCDPGRRQTPTETPPLQPATCPLTWSPTQQSTRPAPRSTHPRPRPPWRQKGGESGASAEQRSDRRRTSHARSPRSPKRLPRRPSHPPRCTGTSWRHLS